MLTERLEFVIERDSEIFAAIPDTSAVFLLRGDDPQSEPYVSKTAHLRRRLQRLLGHSAHVGRRLVLRDRVRWIEYTSTGSDFESGFLLYKLLRSTFPKTYSDRLRLRFAPLIRLHLENQFPRATVTTKISRYGRSLYYGPFASRAFAEKFASDSLDLFKMRRCVEDLDPDPAFPGCIYSEMKMCLAPCFKGCSDEEYHAEVVRVKNLLDTNGQATLGELSAERNQASTNLDFEKAADIHARIEKLKPVLSQIPEIVHRIDLLSGVIVQPSAATHCVALFRIDSGQILGPVHLSIQPPEHTKAQSMEARVQEALGAVPSHPSRIDRSKSTVEVMEDLAILKRWYYRSNRIGEAFFADGEGTLPMRRIVRGISRVYRGEKPEPNVLPTGPASADSIGPQSCG